MDFEWRGTSFVHLLPKKPKKHNCISDTVCMWWSGALCLQFHRFSLIMAIFGDLGLCMQCCSHMAFQGGLIMGSAFSLGFFRCCMAICMDVAGLRVSCQGRSVLGFQFAPSSWFPCDHFLHQWGFAFWVFDGKIPPAQLPCCRMMVATFICWLSPYAVSLSQQILFVGTWVKLSSQWHVWWWRLGAQLLWDASIRFETSQGSTFCCCLSCRVSWEPVVPPEQQRHLLQYVSLPAFLGRLVCASACG